MAKARLLISHAHEEYLPQKTLENLEEVGIVYDIKSDPLTSLDELHEYTCFALIRPKFPPSKEEAEIIKQYKENKGGVFLVVNFTDNLDFENFNQNDILIESLFDANLINKRVRPAIVLEKSKGDKRWYYEVETHDMGLELTLESVDQSYALGISQKNISLDEGDIEFITAFYGEDVGKRTILERNVQSSIYNNYKPDYSKTFYEKQYEEVRSKISEYDSVGIVSNLMKSGRAVGFSSDRLINEIENEGKQSKQCQEFINECFLWVSNPTAYKLKTFKDERAERIKLLEQQLAAANQQLALANQKIEEKDRRINELLSQLTSIQTRPKEGEIIPKYNDLLNEIKTLVEVNLPAALGLDRPVSDLREIFSSIEIRLTRYLFGVMGYENRGLDETENDIWDNVKDLKKKITNRLGRELLTDEEKKLFGELCKNIRRYVKSELEKKSIF